jgi:ubiquinone/menaquinone biosynthesis C-methylase UbiE
VRRKEEGAVAQRERPETIDNRWDILYRDYPEVYEEWAQIEMHPAAVDVINRHFPLAGKVVADVGSGTGNSTLKLARYAALVIGIEPEASMRAIAMARQRERQIANVRFQEGTAESLPLPDRSVDVVMAITCASPNVAAFAAESQRAVKSGGWVIRADVAPGWYGGELAPIISGKPRDETPAPGSRDEILAGLGYEHMDFTMDQDYGTVEKAVRTYGFIFGQRAIDYIREHNQTTIRWKGRIHYKRG